MTRAAKFYLSVVLGLLSACSPEPFVWDLPSEFPTPRVPDDNPMSVAKVELGRRLFYDTKLSGNESMSCGSCHKQELAFTDGLALSLGSTGQVHPRGSMSLANVAYAASLAWGNPLLRNLEDQALIPMFGEEPVELGLAGKEDELLARLQGDSEYPLSFEEAFPEATDPISLDTITKSLGAFQRTLMTFNSPYDRFIRGDSTAMSESAKRGLELFNNELVECFHCHGGFNFASAVDHANNVFDQAAFNNNGLYNVDGRGAYPTGNEGVYDVSGELGDRGRFKAPTLRNIVVTAPYMHDGSIETLEEVIDHYAAGGRNVTMGDSVGDGRENPNKSAFVSGFEISEEQKADLIEFLRSLTDEQFLSDPKFSDPFAN